VKKNRIFFENKKATQVGHTNDIRLASILACNCHHYEDLETRTYR